MWVEEGKRAAAVVLAGAIWRRCLWCGMEEGKGWGLVIGESQPHNVCLSQLAPVVVVRLVIRVVIITTADFDRCARVDCGGWSHVKCGRVQFAEPEKWLKLSSERVGNLVIRRN
jgi:hypothetical protein